MAQMITLEEAAARLGISQEEMKRKLKTDRDFSRLSQIRGGPTIQFKLAEIEELARQLGGASDEGLPLAPLEADAPPGSDEFRVPPAGPKSGVKKPSKPVVPPPDAPLEFDTSEDEVFSLAEELPEPGKPPVPKSSKSSGRLVPSKPVVPKPQVEDFEGSSDSDVRLDAPAPAGKTGSKTGGKIGSKTGAKPAAKGDEAAVPTEEIAIDFSGPGSAIIKGGSSAKLSAPKSPASSAKIDKKGSKADDSSEFELSLDADSDDFDLQMNPEAEEIDLSALPRPKDGKRSSASGINLSVPSDAGISLEKGKDKGKTKPKPDAADAADSSDVDFELSLDSSAVSSSTKLGAPKSGKLVLDSDSDSEFELTLDDSGGSLEQAALDADLLEAEEDKGDIFETDFEIPQMPDESASEAVALESDTDLEKSDDFELAMDDSDVSAEESASEVVLLDDEEGAPKGKKKPAVKAKKKPAAEPDDEVDLSDEGVSEDDEASVSKALRGAKGRRKGPDEDEDEDEEATPAGAGAGATAPWGILPVLFLAPAFVVVFVGALMGYELLNTMWGYQQPRKPAAPLVRGIASTFDMELKDQ
ncbi:MAG: hypothetical protein K2V38_01765 [Gemmataceae bacterium]|nr:hypothetical protein [Gemmataceae bacterium]